MADRLEDVRRENDELKQTVLNVEEKYEKLQRCLNFKDRENTSLEIRNGQLQNQVRQKIISPLMAFTSLVYKKLKMNDR